MPRRTRDITSGLWLRVTIVFCSACSLPAPLCSSGHDTRGQPVRIVVARLVEAMALLAFLAGLLVILYRVVHAKGESGTGPEGLPRRRRWRAAVVVRPSRSDAGVRHPGNRLCCRHVSASKAAGAAVAGLCGQAVCLVVLLVDRDGLSLSCCAGLDAGRRRDIPGGRRWRALHTWGQSDWIGGRRKSSGLPWPNILNTFLNALLVLAAVVLGITYLLLQAGRAGYLR